MQRDGWRWWARWVATAAGFPAGGALAHAVVGPADAPIAALLGGVMTGAVVGVFQSALALRGEVPAGKWVGATALGLGVGLATGAEAGGYGTDMADLALMGALTGLGVGLLQAWVLGGRPSTAWMWVLANPPLWAASWAVTRGIGVDVSRQWTVFGASGALLYAAVTGLLLRRLLSTHTPPRGTAPTPDPTGRAAR